MLEKWYVWDGRGKLPKKHKRVMTKDGFVDGFTRSKQMWRQSKLINEGCHIIAFTLGEKVDSKRGATNE